jgi:hypothetical protein
MTTTSMASDTRSGPTQTPPAIAPAGSQAASTAATSTLGELVATVSREASALVRDEIALARAEIQAEARNGLAGGILLAAAGLFGLLMLAVLTAAFVVGVAATGLHLGWSLLIVAGTYLLLAGILALIGQRSLRRLGPPQRTVRTVKGVVDRLRSRGAQDGAVR